MSPSAMWGEALGYDVEWKSSAKTANVITKKRSDHIGSCQLKECLGRNQRNVQSKEKPNAKVAITYGGSGALQQQIEQGSPGGCVPIGSYQQHERPGRPKVCWKTAPSKTS